ncbi:IS1380 family transposase [bacterium]|nr:MAG: IS1380 family transposase [bacterium]RKZ65790.1 MAG: IS1380 family transposase [Gammaproteobacteria bacterium]
MTHPTKQTVLFPELLSKPATVVFDQSQMTSDGGALLLKAVDEKLGLTCRLASSLADPREPGKVRHSLCDMLRQRIFGICCGYGDTNDVARIGADPMHKLLLDRDPIDGCDLASQPTLSRFENDRRRVDLYRLGEALAETVIKSHRRRLGGRKCKLVTLDLDPTDDPVHGQQQLSLFNGHYDSWCYLPMLAFATFNDESDQHLLAAVLRPGTAHPKIGTASLLKRLIPAIKKAFPFAVVRVRLDGGFACPEVLDYLDGQSIEYLVGMGKNSVLQEMAASDVALAAECFAIAGKTVPVYGEQWYAAQTWDRERRVIHKAEVVDLPGRKPRNNLRFVVTNMGRTPREVYDIYRRRGDSENRIKELKGELDLGRLSCHGFWANQLRLLLSAAAFVLMQSLRLRLARVGLAAAQVQTLRLRLLKIGGRVTRSVRRYVIHLAAAHPWAHQWQQAARAWGAAVP